MHQKVRHHPGLWSDWILSYLKTKESEYTIFGNVKKWRLRFFKFPHMKIEEQEYQQKMWKLSVKHSFLSVKIQNQLLMI